MNAYQKRQKQKKRNGIFRKWHRRLGFVASLFLLNLAVTGILLNHYESFSLNKSFVSTGWILDLYGISSPQTARCYRAEPLTACQMDRFIYLNQQYWIESDSDLLNLVSTPDAMVAATATNLYFLNRQGQLIEDLAIKASLGKRITGIFWSDETLIASTGTQQFRLDFDLLEWSPAESLSPNSTDYSEPNSTELVQLQTDYRQRQITHLKLVQDLHSGRILMLSGQVVNDIAAIILILLAISGFITWQRRLKKSHGE